MPSVTLWDANDPLITWLLDSDTSLRYQVLRDLLHAPSDVVAAEFARIATAGWGARLLALQHEDGTWNGAPWMSPGWIATMDTLVELKDLGLDPASPQARAAIALVRDNVDWGPQWGHSPFFEGEVEACINGRVLAAGAYFGEPSKALVDRFLSEQKEDGGWNCYESKRSSFHSTICVLEGLLEYEKAKGPSPAITTARLRAHEYLLERRLLRALSTGEIIKPEWTQLSYPPRWHYDVLRALDYFRSAAVKPDDRMAEAIEVVKNKRDEQGRWPLENTHPGVVHFQMEAGDGEPSRWNTLRALRVLEWYSGRDT